MGAHDESYGYTPDSCTEEVCVGGLVGFLWVLRLRLIMQLHIGMLGILGWMECGGGGGGGGVLTMKANGVCVGWEVGLDLVGAGGSR